MYIFRSNERLKLQNVKLFIEIDNYLGNLKSIYSYLNNAKRGIFVGKYV